MHVKTASFSLIPCLFLTEVNYRVSLFSTFGTFDFNTTKYIVLIFKFSALIHLTDWVLPGYCPLRKVVFIYLNLVKLRNENHYYYNNNYFNSC